jgi:23S rRNA (cytidine1920-2'-O)/16S rRNA (cytidine1409-2'-O)-methyltransferase
MSSRIRLDAVLLKAKLVRSKSQAQDIIKRGLVTLSSGQVATKAGQLVSENEIQGIKIAEFNAVSRAGDKLKNAAAALNLSFKDKIVLDIGQSTGGFTQFALDSGASRVIGVDVGVNQIEPTLRDYSVKNPDKLIIIENLNSKDLNKNTTFLNLAKAGINMVVVDVSFIALSKALEGLETLVDRDCQLVTLFKPQFELNPKALNKSGVVRQIKEAIEAKVKFITHMSEHGFMFINESASELKGKNGNQEYFILFKKV